MTLRKAKSIARHLGLTLREVCSGDYRVNFRDGNETTAYYTDNLEDAVNAAVEMTRKQPSAPSHQSPGRPFRGFEDAADDGAVAHASRFVGPRLSGIATSVRRTALCPLRSDCYRIRAPRKTVATCYEPSFSPNGCYGTSTWDQSALMPTDLITLAHFSVSSAMSLPKSAGETTSGVTPKTASRAFILGSARPALISLLSLSTMSAGVFLGMPTPYQLLAS